MAKKLKITLIKSYIGRPEDQRRSVLALGLGKLQSSVIKYDTPDIRGQVRKLSHLVSVEEIEA